MIRDIVGTFKVRRLLTLLPSTSSSGCGNGSQESAAGGESAVLSLSRGYVYPLSLVKSVNCRETALLYLPKILNLISLRRRQKCQFYLNRIGYETTFFKTIKI